MGPHNLMPIDKESKAGKRNQHCQHDFVGKISFQRELVLLFETEVLTDKSVDVHNGLIFVQAIPRPLALYGANFI